MSKLRSETTGWARPPRPERVSELDDPEIDRRETEELAYLIARDEWLAARAPELVYVAPRHECSLLVPGTASGDEVHFDELDERAGLCGVRWLSRGRRAFGAADEVIRAVTGDDAEEAWVEAVIRALQAERTWPQRSRRAVLEVWKGNGELVHLTPAANRESIQAWGLDWSRMGPAARGIAGSTRPELPAIFLDTIDSVGFFKHMTKGLVDLWAVDVTGLWVENGPDGWYIHTLPIGCGRLRLLEGDWVSAPRALPSFVSRGLVRKPPV